jgi:hypothetical protein
MEVKGSQWNVAGFLVSSLLLFQLNQTCQELTPQESTYHQKKAIATVG